MKFPINKVCDRSFLQYIQDVSISIRLSVSLIRLRKTTSQEEI